MKKMVLSVIWLAIAGVFTTMTMSACSDDEEENNSSTCPYDSAQVSLPLTQLSIQCWRLGARARRPHPQCPHPQNGGNMTFSVLNGVFPF